MSFQHVKFTKGEIHNYCWISMFPNVHLSERAHISNADNFNGKVMEEFDDLLGFLTESDAQDKRCNEWAKQLLQ